MIIRAETPSDIDAIYALTQAAFAPMSYSDGTEQDCINALRDDGDLSQSLVAEIDAAIVGHVAFSPVTINGSSDGWYGLGPISVVQHLQKTGIGSTLIHHGLLWLKTQKAKGCVLIGDPNYYFRFGFVSDGNLTYHDIPTEYVQWLGFDGNVASGKLLFACGLEPKPA